MDVSIFQGELWRTICSENLEIVAKYKYSSENYDNLKIDVLQLKKHLASYINDIENFVKIIDNKTLPVKSVVVKVEQASGTPQNNRIYRHGASVLDKFEECPICRELVSTKNLKNFEEHVNICMDRNTDESGLYDKENNNGIIIGATQMVTRGRRSLVDTVLKKPRQKPKIKAPSKRKTPLTNTDVKQGINLRNRPIAIAKRHKKSKRSNIRKKQHKSDKDMNDELQCTVNKSPKPFSNNLNTCRLPHSATSSGNQLGLKTQDITPVPIKCAKNEDRCETPPPALETVGPSVRRLAPIVLKRRPTFAPSPCDSDADSPDDVSSSESDDDYEAIRRRFTK